MRYFQFYYELHYGLEAGKPLSICSRRRFEVEESLKTSLCRNNAKVLDGRAEGESRFYGIDLRKERLSF